METDFMTEQMESTMRHLRAGEAMGFVQCLRGDKEAAQKAVKYHEDLIKDVETWGENWEWSLDELKENLALLRSWIDADATELNKVLKTNKE